MTGHFLIDLTDPQFFVPDNAEVLEFIRRANPFAHSDVGSVLFDVVKQIPGAQAYCPSVRSYAYVVLHTAAHRIFATAYDMRGLAVRLSAVPYAEALVAGGVDAAEIGADWVRIDPWGPRPTVGGKPYLVAVVTQAYNDAMGIP